MHIGNCGRDEYHMITAESQDGEGICEIAVSRDENNSRGGRMIDGIGQ